MVEFTMLLILQLIYICFIINRHQILTVNVFEYIIGAVLLLLRVGLVHDVAGVVPLIINSGLILNARLLHNYLHAWLVAAVADEPRLVINIVRINLINLISLGVRSIILYTFFFYCAYFCAIKYVHTWIVIHGHIIKVCAVEVIGLIEGHTMCEIMLHTLILLLFGS